MLVEEIDRLHVELWHARMLPPEGGAVATDLHTRLRQALGADEGAEVVEEEPEPQTQTVRAGSPQAWINALRRQK